MKKRFTSMIAISLLALTGCASTNHDSVNTMNTGISIGKSVFQAAVNNKCRSELTSSPYWKATQLLGKTKQEEIQTNVCGCVSTKAVENVTTAELATAVVDQNARNQMVVTAVSNSLQSCYGQIMSTFTSK